MRINMDHKDYSKVEKKGLVNGGVTILKCSNCEAPLIEVLVTQPFADFKMKYKAKCPHCNDFSFPITIEGGIYMGHTEYTTFCDTEVNKDVVTISTCKGNKEWKKK